MEIEYKGANSLVIKAGSTSLVINPKLSGYGLKNLKVEGVVEIVTDEKYAIRDGEKLLISGAGEYEIADVSVRGVAAQRQIDPEGTRKGIMYGIHMAGFRLVVLDHISEKLSEDQLEELGLVDILVIPVGGNGFTLDAQGAASVVRQIDPKVVIPTHYADKGVNYEVEQQDLTLFLAALGAPSPEVIDKYKLKAGATLPEVLTIYKLERS